MSRGLDTYIGRPVTNIQSDTDGNWFVELVGGVRVLNMDKTIPPPDIANPLNLIFVTVLMSEEQTQMVLATLGPSGSILEEWRASFNPSNYQIYDPDYQSGQAFAPQQEAPIVEVPPYPADRDVGSSNQPSQGEPHLAAKEPEKPAEKVVEEPSFERTDGLRVPPEEKLKKTTKSKKSSSKKSTKKKKQ